MSRNPSPARDAPHPDRLRCRRSTHKTRCDSLLRLAARARMRRSLIDDGLRDTPSYRPGRAPQLIADPGPPADGARNLHVRCRLNAASWRTHGPGVRFQVRCGRSTNSVASRQKRPMSFAAVVGQQDETPRTPSERAIMTEPKTHTLDVPGAVLHYDVRSNESSTAPVLLLIGSPMGAAGFGTLAGHFADRTVVTYDPRGVERSERTDDASKSTPDEHADDLHRLISGLAGPVDI